MSTQTTDRETRQTTTVDVKATGHVRRALDGAHRFEFTFEGTTLREFLEAFFEDHPDLSEMLVAETEAEASGVGQRYAVRFDGDGLSTYQCTEYGPLGMRGAVLVGEGPGNRVSPLTATVLNGVTLLGAGALAYGVYSHVRESRPRDGRGPAV